MNLSWLVRTFVNVMWPFVDSVTKSKVKFCAPEELGASEDVAQHVLLKECGGNVDVSLAKFERLMKVTVRSRDVLGHIVGGLFGKKAGALGGLEKPWPTTSREIRGGLQEGAPKADQWRHRLRSGASTLRHQAAKDASPPSILSRHAYI
jgi:hypothetical protein